MVRVSTSYERLVHEHDTIDDLCVDLLATSRREPSDASLASRLLSELATIVRWHLEEEDRAVYATLIERYGTSADITPGGFEEHFELLKIDWEGYLSDWTPDCVAADPETFGDATEAMLPRLRDRVRVETDLIYPLALRDGSIALRHGRQG